MHLSCQYLQVVISSAFESSVGLAALVATAKDVNEIQCDCDFANHAHGLATDAWFASDVVPPLSTLLRADNAGMTVDVYAASELHLETENLWRQPRNEAAVQRLEATVHGATYSFSALHVGQRSTKPLILFLHGFLGTAADWLPVMHATAAAGYECLALDLPGHGGTIVDDGDRDEPWSIECVADAVHAAMHGRDVVVVGYSMGARVGMALAARHPTLGVVCCSGNPGVRGARCTTSTSHDNMTPQQMQVHVPSVQNRMIELQKG